MIDGKPPVSGEPLRARVYMPSQAMWLHASPDNTSQTAGEVQTGDLVWWYPATRAQGRLCEWYWVEGDKGAGWLPSLFGNIEFAPIPPLNEVAAKRVESQVFDILSQLAASLRDFSDWLIAEPTGVQGVFV